MLISIVVFKSDRRGAEGVLIGRWEF
jgi:hypothetical protein